MTTLEYVTRRIDHLSELEANWDSYGAKPLSQLASNALLKFIMNSESLPKDEPLISLSVDGDLFVEWYCGYNQKLELFFYADGTADFCTSLGEETFIDSGKMRLE
jgi:hypothetical protein